MKKLKSPVFSHKFIERVEEDNFELMEISSRNKTKSIKKITRTRRRSKEVAKLINSSPYEKSSQYNTENFDSRDVKSMNDKINNILNSKTKQSRLMQPGIKILLEEYEIPNLFAAEEFRCIETGVGSLTSKEESEVNERIIELLCGKIKSERENRVQTEKQMKKLQRQNEKQIEVLEKMLKGSKNVDE